MKNGVFWENGKHKAKTWSATSRHNIIYTRTAWFACGASMTSDVHCAAAHFAAAGASQPAAAAPTCTLDPALACCRGLHQHAACIGTRTLTVHNTDTPTVLTTHTH